MAEWECIIEFKLCDQADAQWQDWQESHDISNVSPTDIRIDTGHGEIEGKTRDVRRYCIRKEALGAVKAISSDREDA